FKQLTNNRLYTDGLLQSDFTSKVTEWLLPLEQGTLPNEKIRTAVLQAVNAMEITQDYMMNINLGRLVRGLSVHPRETPLNRQLAAVIYQRWAREALNIPETMQNNLDEDEDENDLPNSLSEVQRKLSEQVPIVPKITDKDKLDKYLDERSKNSEPGEPNFRYNPKRPKQAIFNFVIAPKSDVSITGKSEEEIEKMLGKKSSGAKKGVPSIEQKMANAKKSVQRIGNNIKVPHAMSFSIEGRGINI
ncbi:MAG: hypothetical protein EZS28_040713, partial [Streblomastix strix]